MLDVLWQMAGLIVCGIAWRHLRPAGLEPAQTRKVLTSLVYYLLLPALVLSVLWQAPMGAGSVVIAAAAAFGIAVGVAGSWLACRYCKNASAQAGALILAATFPNATYLGLPVLEAAFGPWARSVAIQYDLFACTPLLFTLGISVAARYGQAQTAGTGYRTLLTIPALWAAVLAIIFNIGAVPMPEMIRGLLHLLERGVVPLMLISLGLSLEWRRGGWRMLMPLTPVILLRLLLVPLLVWGFLQFFALPEETAAAVVMEAAMPCMVLGIVICDQFNLDTALYAMAVTATTAFSLITLPLWHGYLVQ